MRFPALARGNRGYGHSPIPSGSEAGLAAERPARRGVQPGSHGSRGSGCMPHHCLRPNDHGPRAGQSSLARGQGRHVSCCRAGAVGPCSRLGQPPRGSSHTLRPKDGGVECARRVADPTTHLWRQTIKLNTPDSSTLPHDMATTVRRPTTHSPTIR